MLPTITELKQAHGKRKYGDQILQKLTKKNISIRTQKSNQKF